MDLKKLVPAFEDDRGAITDILEHIPVDSVTLITSNKGAIRANHYHKESVQYSYILSGKVAAYTQKPDEKVEMAVMESGDLLFDPTYERHELIALEDSVILIVTQGPRGGQNYEDDTFRVPPLHEEYESYNL
jgi:quercetin dioxygenase-like cupin family protein